MSDEWQPIASAPKDDSSVIIGTWKLGRYWRACAMYWDHMTETWNHIESGNEVTPEFWLHPPHFALPSPPSQEGTT